jgi:hypothetical protein
LRITPSASYGAPTFTSLSQYTNTSRSSRKPTLVFSSVTITTIGAAEQKSSTRRSCHDSNRLLLPRCYQTIPNHADPRRAVSVPSVEIFELYIVVDLGGNTLVIPLNQRVGGSSPPRPTNQIGKFRADWDSPFLSLVAYRWRVVACDGLATLPSLSCPRD